MIENGYIRLYRKLSNWGWYKNDTVKSVFIHLLLKANFKESQWEGITIKPGQIITSYKTLAFETGHTVQEVRTAIKKIKATNEITSTATNKFTVVTVVEWEKYQAGINLLTSKATSTLTNS